MNLSALRNIEETGLFSTFAGSVAHVEARTSLDAKGSQALSSFRHHERTKHESPDLTVDQLSCSNPDTAGNDHSSSGGLQGQVSVSFFRVIRLHASSRRGRRSGSLPRLFGARIFDDVQPDD